jgi:hypothetical protein
MGAGELGGWGAWEYAMPEAALRAGGPTAWSVGGRHTLRPYGRRAYGREQGS